MRAAEEQNRENLPLCNKAAGVIFDMSAESGLYDSAFHALFREQMSPNHRFTADQMKAFNALKHEPLTTDPVAREKRGKDFDEVYIKPFDPLNDEFGKKFKDDIPAMEDLQATMLAKLNRPFQKLSAIEAVKLNGMFLGPVTLDYTARYFQRLSNDLGCPALPSFDR